MQYIEFKTKLQDYLIFNQDQIKLVFPDFDQHRLKDWQKKNYIKKLCKGFYYFTDLEINDIVKYNFANQIYEPSYISLERVLSLHALIPETVFGITSVTTRKSRNIYTDCGSFIYRTIKPDLFFGYTVETINQVKYKIASIEKAVLDYFYLNAYLNSIQAIKDVRFDSELFFEIIDQKKFNSYLSRFNSKALERRIKTLRRSSYDA